MLLKREDIAYYYLFFSYFIFQDTPNTGNWNLWWAASNLIFCVKGHSSALYNSVATMTRDSYILTFNLSVLSYIFQ